MGGTVEVHSELGKGSEFVVYLDFERVDDKDPGREDYKIIPNEIDDLHVLLCEDNAMHARCISSRENLQGPMVS